MSDPTPEQEGVLQSREIPLGTWFKPLENYAAIPYGNQTPSHADKQVMFTTPGFGNWGLILDWDQTEYQGIKERMIDRDKRVDVILLDEEKVISLPELVDLQTEVETRLMRIIVGDFSEDDFIKESLNPTPFWVTLRSPLGKQYWTKFPVSTEWFQGQEKVDELAALDTSAVMEQIELRVDKIPGS